VNGEWRVVTVHSHSLLTIPYSRFKPTMTTAHRFRLDRRVPVALLFAFLLQTGGALFWAGSAAQRIVAVEQSSQANAGAIERVVRLEEQLKSVRQSLERIEGKIDRLGGDAAKRETP